MAWISIATMLALFDIVKPVDESGNIIEPSLKYATGAVGGLVTFILLQ